MFLTTVGEYTGSVRPRTVYRVGKAKYDLTSAEGARLYGGRWNRPGAAVLYTSSNLALAMFEVLIHTGRQRPPEGFAYLPVQIASQCPIEVVEYSDLPGGELEREWCVTCGTRWLRTGRAPVLCVPSAAMPSVESNWILGPEAPTTYADPEPLAWDRRLFG